jgi:hypothetical protein
MGAIPSEKLHFDCLETRAQARNGLKNWPHCAFDAKQGTLFGAEIALQ